MFKPSDYKENAGGSISKIIEPGQRMCIIRNISLESPPYNKDAYYVQLLLEAPVEDPTFTGIAISKLNPSLGNYKGQVGFVNSGRYPFSTYTYGGKTIDRDSQIFRWITSLANKMGVLSKMTADNVEADSIEEYVKIVSTYLKDMVGIFTIGGSEYFTEGYSKPNYRLFFPKLEKNLYPFSLVPATGTPSPELMPFDASKHIIVKTPTATTSVENSGSTTSMSSSSLDLNLDLPTDGLFQFQAPETEQPPF